MSEPVIVPPNPNYTAEVVVLLTSLGADRKQKRGGKLVCDLLETKRVHRKVIDMNMDARAGRDRGESVAMERLVNRKELESWQLPQVFIDGCLVGDQAQLQTLEDDGILGRILRRQLCLKCHSPKNDMVCAVCNAEFEEVLPHNMSVDDELKRLYGTYTEEDRADEDSDSGSEAGERFDAYNDAWWQTYGNEDPAWSQVYVAEETPSPAPAPACEPTAASSSSQAEEPEKETEAETEAAKEKEKEKEEENARRRREEEEKAAEEDKAKQLERAKELEEKEKAHAKEKEERDKEKKKEKEKKREKKKEKEKDKELDMEKEIEKAKPMAELKKQVVKQIMDDSAHPPPLPPLRYREKGSAAALLRSKKRDDALVFGLDKEAEEKKVNKYDISLVEDVVDWIERITCNQKGEASLADWLKDGQVLCALANGIKPGVIKRVSSSPLPFKQMENITMFMNVARDFGVPESAMFGTPDLFEEKDLGAVVNCVYTFGGAVQVNCPEFTGPKLGIPLNVSAKTQKREKVQVTQFSGYSGALEKTEVPKAIPLGMTEGTANEECLYGMDRDIKEKLDAKYDVTLEKQVVDWIETVSGEKKGEQTVGEWLKNGRVLCVLVNAIRPGTIKKVHSSSLAFKQMENITFFTNVAREVGVPESTMFGTADLFEEKNLGSVINCIFTFAGALQVRWPEFEGPHLGVPLNVESKSNRRKPGLLTDLATGFSAVMEVERPTDPLHVMRHNSVK